MPRRAQSSVQARWALSVLLGVALSSPIHAQTAKRVKPTSLKTDGRSLPRSLSGGDEHGYRIRLEAGQYCVIPVRQLAIDLIATIQGPNGDRIAEVDSPYRTTGDETVEIVTQRSGTYSLTVRPKDTEAPTGAYEIRVATKRPATEADRRRVETLRGLEQAERLRGQGTAVSLQQARDKYDQALQLFRAAGDRAGVAKALLRAATVVRVTGYQQLAAARFEEAANACREAADKAGEAEALSFSSTTIEKQTAALELSRQAGDRTVEAMVLLNQAGSHYWGRRYEAAKASAVQAAAIFEELHDLWGLARARRTVGMAVQDLESPTVAMPYYYEALRLAERTHDLDMQATAMGSIGWASVYLGEPQKALDAYSRGVELARQAGSRLAEAWQVNAIGQIYAQLGQFQKALTYYEQSLPLTREVGVMMDHGVALGSIGQAYSALGDSAKGLEYRMQALDVFQNLKDRQEEAVQLLSIAVEYDRIGNPDEAFDYFNKALQIQQALGNRRREGWTLNRLGAYYADRGDYRRALELEQQALDASRAVADRVGEVRSLLHLADVYRLLGEPQRALDHYEQALAAARRNGLKLDEASSLVRLGWALADEKDYNGASQRYSEALSLVRAEGTTFRAAEAAALEGVGAARRATSDLTGSVAAYEEALDIARTIRDRTRQVEALNGLGQTLVDAGQIPKALGVYAEALQLARESRLRAAEGLALRNLMSASRAAGRLQLAVFYGKQAVNLFQTVRASLLQLEPQTQRSYVRSKEQVYRELADLLITEGRLPEAQQVLDFLKEEEFREYVRRRADASGPARRVDLNPDEADWERRYREIEDQLVTLGRQRADLAARRLRSPEEDAQLGRLDADMKVAARTFQTFLDSLAADFNAKPGTESRIFHLREAQGLMSDLREMGSGTVALYTIVGERRYCVILITADVQKAAEYPISASDLARKVLAFREALQNRRVDPRPLAQELYTILVAPIAHDLELAHARTLMWSLDGVLRYVPFSALHDGRGYLIERYRTTVFTPASNSRLKDRPAAWASALGVGITKAQPGFDPLPDVAEELRGIIRDGAAQDTGPGPLRGRVLLDEAFTEPALRTELRLRPPVVHVASHFQFRPGNESDSFLLLGDGRRLSVADLKSDFNLFDGVDLLTLSACDTATAGAGATGKEVESFGALAQRNGAKAVIATLWPVADVSTRVLMQRFYRARTGAASVSKAEALQIAQLALLRGDRAQARGSASRARAAQSTRDPDSGGTSQATPYAHPYYWAPFLLIGNWR